MHKSQRQTLDKMYKSFRLSRMTEREMEVRPFCGRDIEPFHLFALFISPE